MNYFWLVFVQVLLQCQGNGDMTWIGKEMQGNVQGNVGEVIGIASGGMS